MDNEVRTYKTDIDLRRAWKQLRNQGRFVRFHVHDPLSLVVGPLISDSWEHRTYKRSDLAARAISQFRRHGYHIGIPCPDHENCVMILDTDKVNEAKEAPKKLKVGEVGDKVKIIRGGYKCMMGTVEEKTSKGTILVRCDLCFKIIFLEVWPSFTQVISKQEAAKFETYLRKLHKGLPDDS